MNIKYKKYIDYIVNDIELPYLKYLNMYGLSEKEYEIVLSKVYDQPVTIKGNYVYDTNGNKIYYETGDGGWVKREYDTNGNEIYRKGSTGSWVKKEYDNNGLEIYWENSDGYWIKKEYDNNGLEIYWENSYGDIVDNRLDMKDKYKKYMEYIAKDIKPPYIHNMVNQYNLNEDEVFLVLSIIYDTPVHKKDYWIRDNNGNKLYYESINEEYWIRIERDNNGKLMMRELSPAAREDELLSIIYTEIDNRFDITK